MCAGICLGRTVKKAVELLDVPSRNAFLMWKNKIALLNFLFHEHMLFFFHPVIEQESSTSAQFKKYVPITD
jgi:hypothetical protein